MKTTDPFFNLHEVGDRLVQTGYDDLGRPFRITYDRVWAANLAEETTAWLEGRTLVTRDLCRNPHCRFSERPHRHMSHCTTIFEAAP